MEPPPGLEDTRALVTRCAWCARYSLGADWVDQETADASFARDGARVVTHGICPGCVESMRHRGLSR
jgi:hypothetical protein